MTDRIVGKVARINSDRELVINRGSEHGVEVGTYFYVKDEPVEITDPDTNEILGSVNPIKAVVRVREIGPKFCIARTFRTRRVQVEAAVRGNGMFHALNLGMSLQPPQPAKFETRTETLRFDPAQGAPIDEWDSVVNVGDSVESLVDGESLDPATTTMFQ